jgi:outer membrane receptor protein involved in Fe transport
MRTEWSSCGSQSPTELLNGASNRHYRTKQAGAYVQDDIRLASNFTLDIGLRWDWDGPLVEKNGLLTNFYSQDYSYDAASDTVNNIGLVVAGNNPTFGTKGVSASTLTGRQWGFAPRVGFAYSPSPTKNVVIRAGF